MAKLAYVAPLRCAKCGVNIEKKPKAKTPRYCPPCRVQLQADWKKKIRENAYRRYRK